MQTSEHNKTPVRLPRWLLVGLALFVGALVLTGYGLYVQRQKEIVRNAHETLATIADLKVGQIVNWVKERKNDAELALQNLQTQKFLANPDNSAVREELLLRMATYQRICEYSAVALLDAHGTVRLAVPADRPVLGDDCAEYVRTALRAREGVVMDLHRNQASQLIHMSLLVPVGIKPQPNQWADGVLVFLIDPYKFLYPLVQSWPTPSRSAETLLVRREGNEVVYLNELRHHTNTALLLRFPISTSNLPAARVVQGHEGVVEGKDYRGIPVLAATRKIPGTPWFMVAKVDQQEVFAPLRREAWTIGLLTGLLLLAVVLGVGLLSRQQKLAFSRRELAERQRAAEEIRRLNADLEQRVRDRTAELQQAGDALRVSEERYRGVVEDQTEIICRFRSDGTYLFVNDVYCRFFGKSAQELVGSKWQPEPVPEDVPLIEEKLRTLSPATPVVLIENRVYAGTGQMHWMQFINRGFFDPQGRLMEIQSVGRDITERKRAQELLARANAELERRVQERTADLQTVSAALREREEQLRLMVDSVNDYAIIMLDVEGRVVSWNIGAERMNGYRSEEIIGQHFSRFYTEVASQQGLPERELKAAADNGRFEDEGWRVRKDGSRFWANVVISAIRDEAGRLRGFSKVSRDITERKQSEDALALQARIANIFLAIPDDEMFNEVLKVILDVMCSPFGVFGYLDEAGALVVPTMTRQIWDKCQVPDKTFVFPRATWGDSSWPRAIHEKQANYTNAVSTKAPAGHVTVTRHINLPILFQGEVIGLFQVANKATDYTAADVRVLETIAGQIAPLLSARLRRERAQEALRKLNAELEQRVHDRTAELEAVNKELEAFSYSVSHDLKAPLRAADSFAGFLEEDYGARLDDEGRRLLGVIRDSARDMGQLVNDLLTFSRVSRKELTLARLNMDDLVRDVWLKLESSRAGRQVVLRIGTLPPTFGDATTLREVLVNLLANAIKFTRSREQAVVEVSGQEENSEVVYAVKDNGTGFDMAYKDKLFCVFQRLHSTEEFEGTGIGLALVQRIILRHGGRVWAEGKVGEGATFWFTLPKHIEKGNEHD